MSRIGTIEASIVARLTAALTPRDKPKPKVEVRAWPNDATVRLTHPKGEVRVMYTGTQFHEHGTGAQMVQGDAGFELRILARTLREPNVPEGAEAEGLGAYDLLETCRHALLGWRAEGAADVVHAQSDSFVTQDDGVWAYGLHLMVPTLTVVERPCPPGPWFDENSPNACCTTAPSLTATTISPE